MFSISFSVNIHKLQVNVLGTFETLEKLITLAAMMIMLLLMMSFLVMVYRQIQGFSQSGCSIRRSSEAVSMETKPQLMKQYCVVIINIAQTTTTALVLVKVNGFFTSIRRNIRQNIKDVIFNNKRIYFMTTTISSS